MESEKFCLRWNDFETNISSAFRELREDKDFFDVTLACDDEQIQVHKVILSACSPFFRNVLRRNPHQHPLLFLKGVKYSDLQSVLNFMYHGEVNVAQEDLNSFLTVAEDLKIKGLTQNHPTQPTSRIPTTSTGYPPLLKSAPRNHNRQNSLPMKCPKPPQLTVPTTNSSAPEEEDIQEVVPVKSEPRDIPPAVIPSPEGYDRHHPAQASHALAPVDDQSMDYQDQRFQYEEDHGEYDGEEVVGADGNRGTSENQNLDMDSLISDTGNGTMCLLCNKVLAYRHDARRHIRMKHSGDSEGVTCDLCGKKSKHRWSHADHMRQKHGQYSKQKFMLY